MYPNLFGNPALKMYDWIGVLGYFVILGFFLWKKTWSYRRWRMVLPLVVQLITYTFAGERFAALLPGRSTEFFGYLLISAVSMALAALTMGESPRRWLDDTAPLYLGLASMLKISCFCSGCCHGFPWAYGFYNLAHQQIEFPIQLVEVALYALLAMCVMRYRAQPGQRFALGVAGYAVVRFAVQFFRADQPAFSHFHRMSLLFVLAGGLLWVLWSKKATEQKTEGNREQGQE